VTAGALHVVVPRGIGDPARPSGGNTYDRRLCAGLRDLGWQVGVVEVEGGWPWSADLGSPGLERALRRLPDGARVLVDGLLASRLPEVMVPESRRLRVVLLVHLPVGVDDVLARLRERQVLGAATSVVTTSSWCRDWLVGEYDLDPRGVHVAHPGVDPTALSQGSPGGTSLVTVGTVSPVKGQDQLLAALAQVRDLPWRCACVGSDSVDLDFADLLLKTSAEMGLEDRFVLTGALTGEALEAAYAGADLLVLPSRHETYGMVVADALAHGLPVVAADVGGVREALGTTASGERPGLLVGAGDPAALAAALRRWLTDAGLREDLRAAARERRGRLEGWPVTADRVAGVMAGVAA
jgi:glycosyltransferase involved in cell wall biosynthesis